MAVQGNGTQADPYIVDIWEDFIEKAQENNVYIKFADKEKPEDKVIDMNKTSPEGITSYINVKANIDGNGWTIKNLYIKDLNSSYSSYGLFHYRDTSRTISNLNFLNFYIKKGKLFSSDTCRPTISNCSFSGLLYDNSSFIWTTTGTNDYSFTFYRCSFNLRGISSSFLISGRNYANFDSCNFLINFTETNTDFYFGRQINSLLNGNIKNMGRYLFDKLDTSVINLNFNDEIGRSISLSSVIKSIINSDNKNNATIDYSGNSSELILCDSSQIKNADYLAEHGFPIAVPDSI